MDEETRLEARDLLLRSRIYRFVGISFGAVGVVIFVFLYYKYMEGNVVQALKTPSFVIILLVPFMPAFVLSSMATKSEKKLRVLLEQTKNSSEKARNS